VSDRIEKFQYAGDKADRLDKFLVTCLPEFSRARLQGLIDDGFVSVNGVPAKKSGQSIESGTEIEVRVPPPVPSALVGEDIPLDIIFENDELIIVNKPAGMVVHPAADMTLARWSMLCWDTILIWKASAVKNAQAWSTAWTRKPQA
jgi:23S rRNA-/tRNA-specific pseudouridylate synthase